MGNAPTIANVPGHDAVCDCNRCILARVTIRERRTADRRAEVRTTPERRRTTTPIADLPASLVMDAMIVALADRTL